MTPELRAELIKLEDAIAHAQAARGQWFIDHLDELAELKIGDKIYAEVAVNDYKLQFAGIVTRVYLQTRDVADAPVVRYEFDKAPGYHYSNNTESSYAYFYNHDHWVRRKKEDIDRLQREIS